MNQKFDEQIDQWLNVSAHILEERPSKLQHSILKIYRNKPEFCCYATELAQLRMIGPVMENNLLRIWNAKTADDIDRLTQLNSNKQPADRALLFLATLVKMNIERIQTIH